MRAQLIRQPAPIDHNPLELADISMPHLAPREVLVKVSACGVCHTDLHVAEGELPDAKLPIVPGHEVVGTVAKTGDAVTGHQIGDRVGIPWLHDACGQCEYCLRGSENLCENATFTGYTSNGGYAEFAVARADFVVSIPEQFSDVEAAPLLCAGIVGYRSLKLSEMRPGERLGLYGFGASAHICIQVARYWNCEVFVFTRSPEHQQQARDLGATWVGNAEDQPPTPLDRAIIFAPAGWLVPVALGHLQWGGTLCINAVHMSPIPEMPYDRLWHERTIRTVANATRRDAEEFLPLAAKIPVVTETHTYQLEEANTVLQKLKRSDISGAAVLRIG